MSDQATLQRQVCDVIRRRYPQFRGRTPFTGTRTAMPVVLGPMEPCERCGTLVVPLERSVGRAWYSLARAWKDGGRWRGWWDQHTPERCRRLRVEQP